MEQEETVQTLFNLGLTVLQAKVYLALIKTGTSTGRETAKAAKVASQDVYRILAELQEKGLVEKTISKPNRYSPLPIEKGLTMLLQQRNKQTVELNKAAFEIFKSFQSIDKCEDKNETGNFVLVPKNQAVEHRVTEVFETAQTSIDWINDCCEVMIGHEMFSNLAIKALKRDIKIRVILTENQEEHQLSEHFSAFLEREPEFQARYFHFPSQPKVFIKDNKEVLISTATKTNTVKQPYLWSNNPILLQVIQQWYNSIWEKSSKEYQKGAQKKPQKKGIGNVSPTIQLGKHQ